MTYVLCFKKKSNLDDYYNTEKCRKLPCEDRAPRDIFLYMVVSVDSVGEHEQHHIRIFCPINPFPINTMTVRSYCAVARLKSILINKGWTEQPFPLDLVRHIQNL